MPGYGLYIHVLQVIPPILAIMLAASQLCLYLGFVRSITDPSPHSLVRWPATELTLSGDCAQFMFEKFTTVSLSS